METMSALVEGGRLELLVPALEKELGDCVKYHFGDVFVLYTQSYSLRVNSNLMISVILDFSTPGKCNVRIVSGGGGQGLLGITWGSEGSRNDNIIRLIERMCESKGWHLTAADE